MAFLTMIAPLVAMTYPLDKISDGKAQGFNMWLKEYIFNALLQPVHLIIYAMIMGTVMDLAIEHPFYAMIALGFMIPAEKFIRKMFGFDKASTPAGMGAMGVAGAGLLMSGVNKLVHKPKKGEKEEKESSGEGKQSKKIKFKKLDYVPISGNSTSGTLDAGQDGIRNIEAGDREYTSEEQDNNLNAGQGGMHNIEAGNRGYTQEEQINNWNAGQDDWQAEDTGESAEQVNMGLQTGANTPETISTNNRESGLESANNGKRKLRTKMAAGFRAVGHRYANKGKKMHPLRTARRAFGYALGAGALGAIGLAAGISTGDLGKTMQYTAAAGHVGGSLGKGISEDIANEGMGNKRAFKEGFTDEETKRKKYLDSLVTDYNNREYLREKVGSKQLGDTLTAYRDYAEYGCTDVEKFYAAYQLEKEGLSREEAIYDYKLASRTGDIYKSADAEGKWQKKLEEEYFNDALVQTQYEEKVREIEAQIKQEQDAAEREYQRNVEAAQRSADQAEIERLKESREEARKQYEERKKEQKQKAKKDIVEPLASRTIGNIKTYYKNL